LAAAAPVPTPKGRGLRFGRIPATTIHLCVDMQRLFAEPTEWRTPWMERVLPRVTELVARRPERTIFTRFLPARRAGEGHGTWKRYYERWPNMTVEALGEAMTDLVPELARFVPPATMVDKHVYSPWYRTDLETRIPPGTDTLIVSGGETDVCVLAAVLGAIDRGYRVIVPTDALCSSADETHDASMRLFESRYGQQVETVTTAEVLATWD